MNARDLALLDLDGRELPGWPAGAIRRQPGRRADPPTDGRDVGLAEQIAIGVVKNLFYVEELVAGHSGRPLDRIDAVLRKILAIAVYQLRFLDRIPASAAVDEAVKQARRWGSPRAAGFVNAVLRNVTRDPDGPLPDAIAEPEDYARIVLSHPAELFARLRETMSAAAALDFCRHNNPQPPLVVRVAADADVAALASPGVTARPHRRPGMFVVEGAGKSVLAEWARMGIAQVQDVTSTAVVDEMDLSPGQRVLDRCAGLGTKTLQIWSRVRPGGRVVAMDSSAVRCAGLRRLLKARAIGDVEVRQAEWMPRPESTMDRFERILLDVPCSNSGVLARRPEARYRQDARTITGLGRLQRQILEDTQAHLAAGGRMVYSTCSIWPQENEHIVRAFVAEHAEYQCIRECLTLPSAAGADGSDYHDGGYVAVLVRGPETC